MKAKIPELTSAAGYDLAADNYDTRTAYLNSFEKGRFFNLLPADLSGRQVLDVGAGTGRVSLELAKRGAVVTALDVSARMLEILKKKNPNIQTVIGEAEALPFEDESFEMVTAAFLIVHLKDCEKFFNEVYRILKPGGLFIFTNINQKEPPAIKTAQGEIKIESYYHRPERIRELLEQGAFLIDKECLIKEKDVWVNQVIAVQK